MLSGVGLQSYRGWLLLRLVPCQGLVGPVAAPLNMWCCCTECFGASWPTCKHW
jgi:hypothetical protein